MSTLIEIAVQNRSEAKVPSEKQVSLWAQAAYLGDQKQSVSISLVGAEESQRLNAQYRQKDHPTNVLSFPMELPSDAPEKMLGDIVLCAPVIAREASEQAKPSDAHWAHMVVHGMLHLQGYDHQNDQEAAEMEGLERDILADLGCKDPYSTTEK